MGSMYNPLGTGVAPGYGESNYDSSGSPLTKADPFKEGIAPAAPSPTGPTKDATDKGGNSTKDQERAKPIDVRWKSWMGEKWLDLRTGYTVYHQIVWQNILFYVSMLWIQWDQNRRIWQPAVPEDEWTPQPVVNSFAPASDAIVSVFQMPEVEAVPKTESDMDAHDIAEVANTVTQHFIQRNALEHDFQTKEGKADLASQLFALSGNCLTLVRRWKKGSRQKPKLQQIMPPPPPPPPPSDMLMGQPMTPIGPPPVPTWQPQMGPDGLPMMEDEPLYEAKCMVFNPLYWLPRAGSKGMENVRYGFWAERMSLDEIKDEWGYDATPDNQYLDSMESSWEIALNFYYTGYSSLTQATKESALVIIAFIEPGKVDALPEGGVAVMVNDTVIYTYAWDDYCMKDEWPITHGGYLKVPTTFFYRTPLNDVAHIQKELNRYESIIALHGMTSASDSLIVDMNTKVSNITGRGDRIIYFRSIGPGSKEPHRLQHGSLDAGIYEQRQKLEDKIQNITGAVSVWRGQQAGSVTSAAGISQLRGQAEQMFSKPVDNWRNMWVETVRKGVKLNQKCMQAWEIAAIMGEGHDAQIAKFMAANLDSVLNWVATSHGLPKTRDEKRQDLLSLFDRGALDITDPNVRIRIGELFGDTGMEQQFTKDATRARWENSVLRQAGEVQFMPDIEDLQTHFAVHSEAIKSLDFNDLEQSGQAALLQHAMETKMALDMLMTIAQGGPGGAGGAGGAGAGAGAGPAASPDSPNGGGAAGGGPHGSAGRPSSPPHKASPPSPSGGKKSKGPTSRPGGVASGQSSVPTGPGNIGGR